MELIKFYALLKSTLWGGEKIVPFKHLSTEQHNVGENWEISGVPDNETVVANGVYVGKKLNDIVAILKEKLVGSFRCSSSLLTLVRTCPYRYIQPTR